MREGGSWNSGYKPMTWLTRQFKNGGLWSHFFHDEFRQVNGKAECLLATGREKKVSFLKWPSSGWSWITDLNSNHPIGMHPGGLTMSIGHDQTLNISQKLQSIESINFKNSHKFCKDLITHLQVSTVCHYFLQYTYLSIFMYLRLLEHKNNIIALMYCHWPNVLGQRQ